MVDCYRANVSSILILDEYTLTVYALFEIATFYDVFYVPPPVYHRLRGSDSPAVLTATGFVNRKRQFSTHYRIDTPQSITKTFYR